MTITTTTVGNRAKHPAREGDVYIGRPTRWGNPYKLQHEGERKRVVELYRRWLTDQVRTGKITPADLAALAGKRLMCWCAPKLCHGHVLARAADWAAAGADPAKATWATWKVSDPAGAFSRLQP